MVNLIRGNKGQLYATDWFFIAKLIVWCGAPHQTNDL